MTSRPIRSSNKPASLTIVSHSGASQEAPENTAENATTGHENDPEISIAIPHSEFSQQDKHKRPKKKRAMWLTSATAAITVAGLALIAVTHKPTHTTSMQKPTQSSAGHQKETEISFTPMPPPANHPARHPQVNEKTTAHQDPKPNSPAAPHTNNQTPAPTTPPAPAPSSTATPSHSAPKADASHNAPQSPNDEQKASQPKQTPEMAGHDSPAPGTPTKSADAHPQDKPSTTPPTNLAATVAQPPAATAMIAEKPPTTTPAAETPNDALPADTRMTPATPPTRQASPEPPTDDVTYESIGPKVLLPPAPHQAIYKIQEKDPSHPETLSVTKYRGWAVGCEIIGTKKTCYASGLNKAHSTILKLKIGVAAPYSKTDYTHTGDPETQPNGQYRYILEVEGPPDLDMSQGYTITGTHVISSIPLNGQCTNTYCVGAAYIDPWKMNIGGDAPDDTIRISGSVKDIAYIWTFTTAGLNDALTRVVAEMNTPVPQLNNPKTLFGGLPQNTPIRHH